MGLYASSGVLLTQSTQPSNPGVGDLWYDTVNKLLKGFDGTEYVTLGKTNFSNATITSHSETIGNYSQPSNAVVTTPDTSAILDDDLTSSANFTISADNWTYDAINDEIDLAAGQGGVYRGARFDPVGANISTSKWLLRFKIRVDSITSYSSGNHAGAMFFGFTDKITSVMTDLQDAVGIIFQTNPNTWRNLIKDNEQINGGTTAFAHAPTIETLYIEIENNAGALSMRMYSDVARTVLIEEETGSIGLVTGLRYLHFQGYSYTPFVSASGGLNGAVDDVQFWNGINKTEMLAGSGSEVFDDSTGTKWNSNVETNPAVYIDLGSSKNILGVAIHLHADNTETEFKIRCSADTSFSDAENVRTITVSNLTAGAWKFIRFNLKYKRYLQIYGSSGSSLVMAISEIKYLTMTDNDLKNDEGILEISSSDTSIGLDGV
ncbi:MAG: hypothetical protein COA77_02570 [Thaumarchaeota archaeon]|nr:MAG: hypothetical protein COA77_02570 [Nitrososphaerota archaeon]